MRDIKFKVYHYELKKIFNVLSIDFKDNEIGFSYIAGVTCAIDFNDGKLIQYTGLKDIDDNEIYEGDVLNYYDPTKYKETILEVKWDYLLLKVTENHNRLLGTKIIGNIYENPELIDKINECKRTS